MAIKEPWRMAASYLYTVYGREMEGLETIAAGEAGNYSFNVVETVALSGGVFQNLYLLAKTEDLLSGCGFRVLMHKGIPPNDDGLSLGQALIAHSQAIADGKENVACV
ncbi:MAG: Carbamoyltransferase HypF [Candidatus Dichloromethanomonas elyunquensis]|nr:MAG: Carbamoyltransferase HypF [Candidatus Dichloromethanomonas elyunquensis]